MGEKNINTPEINDKIFWRDGVWKEGMGGYIIKSTIGKIIEEIKSSGENPIAIKINGDSEIEIIIEIK